MGKGIFTSLVAIALLLSAGCIDESAVETQIPQNFTSGELTQVSIDDPHLFSTLSLDDVQSEKRVLGRSNPNAIVKANFLTRGGHRVIISGAKNPGGVHGTGSIKGPFYVDVQFDIVCITQVGNRATVGGQITYADLGENEPGPVVPGAVMYLAVEDNGEGQKDDADRYNDNQWFSPFPVCDFLNPTVPFFWPEELWFDVAGKNDFIQIK